jgi:hypothetical protein
MGWLERARRVFYQFNCATLFRTRSTSTSTIVIAISSTVSAISSSFANLPCGPLLWIGFTSHHEVLLLLLLKMLLLIHVPFTGSSRAHIIKWLEDTGIVHQLLNFITLSPIVSTGSAEDTSSCCRLVDAIDSAPLSPVSLLELAHAQPLQVARALSIIFAHHCTHRYQSHYHRRSPSNAGVLQVLGNVAALLTRVLRLLPAG